MSGLMKRPCSSSECSSYRIHWCDPNTPRGLQLVEVPDDYPEDHPVYCSMTCGLMDGWFILKYESKEAEQTRQAEWLNNLKKELK